MESIRDLGGGEREEERGEGKGEERKEGGGKREIGGRGNGEGGDVGRETKVVEREGKRK